MRLLTLGKVQIAKWIGGDRAILIAMRINEEVTNRRYELAIALGGMDHATLNALKENLADERRHRLWIGRRLLGKRTGAQFTGRLSSALLSLYARVSRRALTLATTAENSGVGPLHSSSAFF